VRGGGGGKEVQEEFDRVELLSVEVDGKRE